MPPDRLCSLHKRQFVQRLLELYRRHPNTTGSVRSADRALADDLYRQGIDIDTIAAALLLAAARLANSAQATDTCIRSLHYFLPVIRELQQQPLDDGYTRYLVLKLRQNDNHHLS